LEVKRFRIEVHECKNCGEYHVTCRPVEYLGREEFKSWLRTCEKRFMNLLRRWVMERVLPTEKEAREFASELAARLGEPFFLHLGRLAPCKVEAFEEVDIGEVPDW